MWCSLGKLSHMYDFTVKEMGTYLWLFYVRSMSDWIYSHFSKYWKDYSKDETVMNIEYLDDNTTNNKNNTGKKKKLINLQLVPVNKIYSYWVKAHSINISEWTCSDTTWSIMCSPVWVWSGEMKARPNCHSFAGQFLWGLDDKCTLHHIFQSVI